MIANPRTVTIAALLVVAGSIDVIGTPLSIVALKHAQRNLDRATAATIQARKDDCLAAEKLRARGRAKIAKEEAELPQTLALLHVKNTPSIEAKTKANFAQGRAQLAPVDCVAYSRKAQP